MGNPNTEKKKSKRARFRAIDIQQTRLWAYINYLDLEPLDDHEVIKPFELVKQGHVLYWRSYFRINIPLIRSWRDPPLKESESL